MQASVSVESRGCLPALMYDEIHGRISAKDTTPAVLEFRVFNEGFMMMASAQGGTWSPD